MDGIINIGKSMLNINMKERIMEKSISTRYITAYFYYKNNIIHCDIPCSIITISLTCHVTVNGILAFKSIIKAIRKNLKIHKIKYKIKGINRAKTKEFIETLIKLY